MIILASRQLKDVISLNDKREFYPKVKSFYKREQKPTLQTNLKGNPKRLNYPCSHDSPLPPLCLSGPRETGLQGCSMSLGLTNMPIKQVDDLEKVSDSIQYEISNDILINIFDKQRDYFRIQEF